MKITIAKHAGFCFGVRRAIDLTFKVRQNNPGKRIFTVGPIIHNPQVIEALTRRGIGIIDDIDDERLKAGDIAIIRAHGIAPEKKALLTARGVQVIDATCPMVLKVHAIIRKAARQADLIAIVGDKDHPEMDAHLGVAGQKGILVQNLDDAQRLASVGRLAVVAQTTFDAALFHEIIAVLREKAEVLDVTDTICRSTVDRQREVQDLAQKHDTFIVIGGRNSANTTRLAEIAANQNREVLRIETADQLRTVDTAHMQRVAIIAGASTPQWVIEQCIEALRSVHTSSRGLQYALLNLLATSPLCPALGALGVAMAALVFSSKPYGTAILCATFFLALATTQEVRSRGAWLIWSTGTGIALCIGLISSGLIAGALIIGIALLRPFLDSSATKDYMRSLLGGLIFVLVGIAVPLSLARASLQPNMVLLAAYVAAHYLGAETLVGLKNMERDAIIGRMSIARYFSEARVILILEYTIMGLALLLFLSFPLKIAPALAYGLLPPLFFLAKGIDLYTDQVIFDNRLFLVYVQCLWLILPLMGLLWLVTMM